MILDSQLAQARSDLAGVKRDRQQLQSYGKLELAGLRLCLDSKTAQFGRSARRGTTDSLLPYQKALTQVYGIENLPAIPVVRKQAILMSVMHQLEVTEKALEFLKRKEEDLQYYMLCEQTVVTAEAIDLSKKQYADKKREIAKKWNQIYAPQKRQIQIQELVLKDLESLKKMQEKIKSHSTTLSTSPHSSFHNFDYNSNLSYRTETLRESLCKLQHSPRKEKTDRNMGSLVKMLLEIDGTFPSIHPDEEEEYLGKSIVTFDEFWPSSSSSQALDYSE